MPLLFVGRRFSCSMPDWKGTGVKMVSNSVYCEDECNHASLVLKLFLVILLIAVTLVETQIKRSTNVVRSSSV